MQGEMAVWTYIGHNVNVQERERSLWGSRSLVMCFKAEMASSRGSIGDCKPHSAHRLGRFPPPDY